MFVHLLHLLLVLFILGVLSPWEFLWRAGSYIFCVRLRCVECRAGTILFGHFLGADGGTVQIFLLLYLLWRVRYG